jgi:hypothetical protein
MLLKDLALAIAATAKGASARQQTLTLDRLLGAPFPADPTAAPQGGAVQNPK